MLQTILNGKIKTVTRPIILLFLFLILVFPVAADGKDECPDLTFHTDKNHIFPLPALGPGLVRVSGVLDSVGVHHADGFEDTASLRGAGWSNGSFGHGGMGNAWFFADVDAANGKVVRAHAWFLGPFRNSFAVIDLCRPLAGSYGKVTKDGWEFTLSGRGAMDERGAIFEEDMKAVIRGSGDILSADSPDKITGVYDLVRANTDFRDSRNNDDTGTVRVITIVAGGKRP